MHQGNGFILAETGGAESVTLTTQQIPIHTHNLLASGDAGDQINLTNNLTSNSNGAIPYIEDPPSVAMNAGDISPVGGSQPHENMQPFLCINFIISLFGIFPSPT